MPLLRVRTSTYELREDTVQPITPCLLHAGRIQKCILDKLNEEDHRLGYIEGTIRSEALDL